jgi:O-antigen/teichoic acid export membrane protein
LSYKKILLKESKNSTIYFISTLITSVASFLIIPIYWSKLSLSDYGIIAVTEIISNTFAIFLGLNLEQGLTRFFHEWEDNEKKIATSSVWIFSWISIFILAPIFYLIIYLFSNKLFPNIKFFPYINLGIIIGFLVPLEKIPFVLFRMLEKPLHYSLSNILTFILTNSFAIILIYQYNYGVIGYLYAIIISKTLLSICYSLYFSCNYTFNLHLKYIIEPLKFSINFILNDFITILSSQGDKYLMQMFLELRLLGIYSICLKFGAIFTSLHSIIKTSFVPFLLKSSKNKDELKLVKDSVPFFVTPLFIGLVGVSFFSGYLIHFIGKSSYYDVIEFLPFVCITLFIPTLYIYYAPGIYLSKKSIFVLAPSLLSTIVFLLCSYFLMPLFGIYGLIESKFISGLCYLSFSIYLSKKLYNWDNNYKFLFIISSTTILFISFSFYIKQQNFINNFYLSITTFIIFNIIVGLILKNLYTKINLKNLN